MFEHGLAISPMLENLRMLKRKLISSVALALALIVVLTTVGCSDDNGDPDEGGIIGTGILLRGTVSETTFASNDVVEVKSIGGRSTKLAIDSNNQFNTSTLSGTGPWVLSVRSSAEIAVYGIVYSDGTRNINDFSDLSLRSWFARQSLNLDTEFASAAAFTKLPTTAEYDESVADVFHLIEPVLDFYNVSGDDVISADYSNDDQEVGAFLNQNTVSSTDGFVNFVLTDPDTETQSKTDSTLLLKSEFRDTGSDGPTVPVGVKALGSANDQIVLVWVPSSDDVAVIAYQVLRDGELIGTTPYPVYIDSGLLAIRPYSYTIIAVDGARNESAPSTAKLGTPLLGADDVRPPAPVLLQKISASGTAIQINWSQENIFDVVSFKLYRDASEIPLLQLTGSLATDTTVRVNENYCYQVTAVDASGNESDLSEELCVDAIDENTVNSSTIFSMSDWNVPDLDSLNCDRVLSSAQVERDSTVLTEGCYSVPESVTIGAGATLTIPGGVVLKFGEATKLYIPKDATLTSNGTRENPVVMTGEVEMPGYWGGVEFQGSKSRGNLLRGTVIQFAGGGDGQAAIHVGVAASRFRLEDSLVRSNLNFAINLNRDGIILEAFRGNLFAENEKIVFVALATLESMVGNNGYVDNDDNFITVGYRTYNNADLVIPNLGIPIQWNGVKITRGSLTIEPGVEFNMINGAIMDVSGAFTAVGTAAQPILMSSNGGMPGLWRGMLLSGREAKTINHVTVEFAGAARSDTGAIEVVCRPEDAATFSVDNTSIIDSAGWGIFLSGAGCTTELGDNITYIDPAFGNTNIP